MVQKKPRASGKRNPATRATTYPWDHRGTYLRTLEASWYAEAPAAKWQGAAVSLGMDVDAIERGERIPSASLTAITEPLDAHSRIVRLYMHDSLTTEEADSVTALTTHWHLQLRRVPSPQPPPELVARSQKVGGYAAALERLARVWPGPNELSFEVSTYYFVDGRRYQPDERLLHSPARSVAVSGRGVRRTLQPKAIVWEFEEEGHPCYLTIDFRRGAGDWFVAWSGHLTASLGADVAATIDDRVWRLLEQVALRSPS